MRKISRFGAIALALALSVTIISPTTALAAKKVSTTQTLNKNVTDGISGYYSNFITKNITVVGSFDTWYEMREYAESKGWYDSEEGDWAEGYDYEYDNGKYIVIYTTYTNTITGKTSTNTSDLYTDSSAEKFASGIRINKDETTYLAVPLKNGDVEIKNVKSSKKSVLKAARFKKKDSVYKTNEGVDLEAETTNGQTTYYYYTSNGEKVVVSDGYSGDAYKSTSSSYATLYIKLTPKKSGKSVLSFDIYNANNVKTGTVKTTVNVVSDTDVFKTVTFAGKSLLTDYSSSKNINYGKKTSDTLWNVSSKKSGKLVVKANKNYQIKKIEVGKLYTENYTRESNDYYEVTASGKKVTHEVDLNGDGDTLDVVNGISEDEVTYKYTTVKSGKKIKLSTVNDVSYSYSYTSKKNSSGTYNYTGADGTSAETYTYTKNGYTLYAPTQIKVTYYDKLSKSYGTRTFTVYRAVKK